MNSDAFQNAIDRAAEAIMGADALLITAGAGMGVDSGLPDFRGPGGFWGVYPALGKAGLRFESIANPSAFQQHPDLAWGFYGHRLKRYRETPPGPAFGILKSIAERLIDGAFVFTSNVDGHFQRAGFKGNEVWECHGSIHHLQCQNGCMSHLWSANGFHPEVDVEQCRLLNEAPICPHCGQMARPNILMFGDLGWIDQRAEQQAFAYQRWRETLVRNPVVIEIGAGRAIPTVRSFSEMHGDFLIRINPRESELDDAKEGVSLPMSGTEALRRIGAVLEARDWWEERGQ